MRASDGPRPCQEARAFYYDLLCPDEATVPASIRRHVATCLFCREQIGRLREMLFEGEREPSGSGVPEDETIETLAEQFRLLDERVTCSDARPCLPQLALAAPQIRIPTPVTVHVDQCPQCAKDLATLRKLRLTADQLRRLGQFLASRNGGELSPWPSGAEDGAPVASCAAEGVVMACHEISAADIFDSVVPFGVPPDPRHKAVAAHIRVCPVCLGKVQKLHRTIHEIVERPDSEIETVYHTAKDTPDAATAMQDACRYPVSVEVMHTGSGVPCDANDSRGTSRASTRSLRHSAALFARVAAVSTVIVALAALLRTTAPTASGTNVGQVRQAVERAPNVQIVVTDDHAQLVQEFLIARRSNRLVQRTTQACVLYDVAHNLKQTAEPRAGIGAPTKLSNFERDRARRIMATCLLSLLEQVSPNTRLHSPVDATAGETGKGLDVYELPRPQPAGDSPVRDRSWVYIDSATGLPQRMEFYRQRSPGREWQLLTTTVFTYPAEQEMPDRIRSLLTVN